MKDTHKFKEKNNPLVTTRNKQSMVAITCSHNEYFFILSKHIFSLAHTETNVTTTFMITTDYARHHGFSSFVPCRQLSFFSQVQEHPFCEWHSALMHAHKQHTIIMETEAYIIGSYTIQTEVYIINLEATQYKLKCT